MVFRMNRTKSAAALLGFVILLSGMLSGAVQPSPLERAAQQYYKLAKHVVLVHNLFTKTSGRGRQVPLAERDIALLTTRNFGSLGNTDVQKLCRELHLNPAADFNAIVTQRLGALVDGNIPFLNVQAETPTILRRRQDGERGAGQAYASELEGVIINKNRDQWAIRFTELLTTQLDNHWKRFVPVLQLFSDIFQNCPEVSREYRALAATQNRRTHALSMQQRGSPIAITGIDPISALTLHAHQASGEMQRKYADINKLYLALYADSGMRGVWKKTKPPLKVLYKATTVIVPMLFAYAATQSQVEVDIASLIRVCGAWAVPGIALFYDNLRRRCCGRG